MPPGHGLDTPTSLEADAADLETLSTGLTGQAEAVGRALTDARSSVGSWADVWHGPRADGLVDLGVEYLDAVVGVVEALESAASTATSWATAASSASDDLRSALGSVSAMESEIARGVEFPGQQSDLISARTRVNEIRAQWRTDCVTYSNQMSDAMVTIQNAGLVQLDVGDMAVLSDDFYYSVLAAASVQLGIDTATLDPSGGLEKAISARAEFLGSEDGALMFLIFDNANQGKITDADGNLSSQDIEAACDPATVEALLRQAAEQNGHTWNQSELDAMIVQITSTAWMMRASRNEEWEQTDDEVGMLDTVVDFTNQYIFAPVVAFSVGALCFGAAAGSAPATGGVSLGAAAYCGGLSAASYSAAQNWANGEGIDGVVDGMTDPMAWSAGAVTGVGFQAFSNFMLRAPAITFVTSEGQAITTWERTTYSGTRVYQRNDLIDLTLVEERTGLTNAQLMARGRAPIGTDGRPLNLHHMLQTPDGPIAEVTSTFHQTYSRIIHINPNTIPSAIDRAAFDSWRRVYWMDRAAGLAPPPPPPATGP